MGSSLRSGPEDDAVEGTKLEGKDEGAGELKVGAIAGVSGSGMPPGGTTSDGVCPLRYLQPSVFVCGASVLLPCLHLRQDQYSSGSLPSSSSQLVI